MKEFSANAVEEQLGRITASPEFVNGPKLGQFLNYVVNQELSGDAAHIKQYTIAVEGLGYGQSFNPLTNPTVRILAGRLRRALDRYYATEGHSDPIVIDIPKGAYVPVFRDRRPASVHVDVHDEPLRSAARALRGTSISTIAVVEFFHLGNQDDEAYIPVGLTGEIIASLTRFPEFSVLGPIAHAAGGPIDFQKIHDDYGAGFALQGWVRRDGHNVRVTTDLLDTTSGNSLWANTFEYDLDNISLFEIEDDVTHHVAGIVGDGLGVVARRLQTDSYRSYLKLNKIGTAILAYNHAWATQRLTDYNTALRAIESALREHPANALLIALLANIYYSDALYEMGLIPNALSNMEQLALRAVAKDPNLQIAHYNRVVQHAFFGRGDACVATARKVVAMNPNHARVLAGCAVATASVGAYDYGKELIERAKALNPQYPGWYCFVDYVIDFKNEDYEKAWTSAQLIETSGQIWQPLVRAAVLGKLGKVQDAEPYVHELLQIKPDFPERAIDHVRRLFVTDEHVDMICDGWIRCRRAID